MPVGATTAVLSTGEAGEAGEVGEVGDVGDVGEVGEVAAVTAVEDPPASNNSEAIRTPARLMPVTSPYLPCRPALEVVSASG